jgi:hypothetical protein
MQTLDHTEYKRVIEASARRLDWIYRNLEHYNRRPMVYVASRGGFKVASADLYPEVRPVADLRFGLQISTQHIYSHGYLFSNSKAACGYVCGSKEWFSQFRGRLWIRLWLDVE